mgnify:CR=1 FL=1
MRLKSCYAMIVAQETLARKGLAFDLKTGAKDVPFKQDVHIEGSLVVGGIDVGKLMAAITPPPPSPTAPLTASSGSRRSRPEAT